MALITSKPSIPVLQSDTFEIQRQKINNLAADINTRLDTAAGTGIGYTYIKSINFNFSVGGEAHAGRARYTGGLDNDSYMYNTFGSIDAHQLTFTYNRDAGSQSYLPGYFFAVNAVSPAQYSLEYNATENYYLQSSSGTAVNNSAQIISKAEKLNIEPAQIVTFFFAGSTSHDNWHIGGASSWQNVVIEDVALNNDKFIVQFALIDGRIATHTYSYKPNTREIDRGGTIGWSGRIILVINAARAASGKHAVRLLERKLVPTTGRPAIQYYSADYDNPLDLLEDNFTVTYS